MALDVRRRALGSILRFFFLPTRDTRLLLLCYTLVFGAVQKNAVYRKNGLI